MALYSEQPFSWMVFNYSIDSLFLLDIIICFNAITMDEDFVMIEDRASIVCNYMQGWFLIDLIAIIPIDFII